MALNRLDYVLHLKFVLKHLEIAIRELTNVQEQVDKKTPDIFAMRSMKLKDEDFRKMQEVKKEMTKTLETLKKQMKQYKKMHDKLIFNVNI